MKLDSTLFQFSRRRKEGKAWKKAELQWYCRSFPHFFLIIQTELHLTIYVGWLIVSRMMKP